MSHQFISQMAIDLEKRSRADAIRSKSGRINKVIGAADAETSADRPGLPPCRPEPQRNTTPQISGRAASQVRGELFGSVRNFGRAINLRQQLRVVARWQRIRSPECRSGTLPARPNCHMRVNRPVDQRRTDGALLHRQQFVRVEFVISECEFGRGLDSEPGAVAIVPRRRRMDLQFRVQFQLGDAAKIFFQNGGFDLELMFIAGVLIVASAAASESKDIAARCVVERQ